MKGSQTKNKLKEEIESAIEASEIGDVRKNKS